MAGVTLYVDNTVGVGDDTHDGTTKAAAKETLGGAFLVAEAGSYIYVKATGIDYDREIINTPLTDVTIDRYDTDTGTSRPIINCGDAIYNSGYCVWLSDNIINLIIKNFHIKGMGTSGGTDSNAHGMFTLGDATGENLTVEDCIIEQRYTYNLVNLVQAFGGTITFRRCYAWRAIADWEDASDSKRIILQVDSSDLLPSLTLEENIFENYRSGIQAQYRTSDSAILIDHNTFVECARSGTGVIVKLSGGTQNGWGSSFAFTNNIIESSDDTAGAVGVKDLNAGHAHTIDYNSWHNIVEANQYTGDEPTAANDMDVEPTWPGCTNKEWEAANIVLATYYAPLKSQAALVIGDSVGGTIGAIQVDLIGDESVIYENRTGKAEADLEYYIVNSAFEDKMFAFSHGRNAQGSRFMYELEVTASRTRPTELRALAIDWFVKRKLKRRYGG